VPIIYDHYFNQNEWVVIILAIIGLTLFWRHRKRFPMKEALIYLLYSIFISIVLDHTISIEPFDFYDVHDSSSYQFIDFLTYVMYGPFGYFYIFIYDYFKIKSSFAPIYILFYSLISMVFEFVFVYIGVFHYKNGYKLYYSLPVYLLVFSLFFLLYRYINQNKANK
jgi:hypothetical protein